MSFTMFFFPAMLGLLVLGAVLLAQGVRQRSPGKLGGGVGMLALVGVCMTLLMEFITRM